MQDVILLISAHIVNTPIGTALAACTVLSTVVITNDGVYLVWCGHILLSKGGAYHL